MHFLIGLGILAGLVWFAFGAGTARVFVGIVLAIPVLLALFFATGELTRGLDGVVFSKLYKSDEIARHELEQERVNRDAAEQAKRAEREREQRAWEAEQQRRVAEYERRQKEIYFAAARDCLGKLKSEVASNGYVCGSIPLSKDEMAEIELERARKMIAKLIDDDPQFRKQADSDKRECAAKPNLERTSGGAYCKFFR